MVKIGSRWGRADGNPNVVVVTDVTEDHVYFTDEKTGQSSQKSREGFPVRYYSLDDEP